MSSLFGNTATQNQPQSTGLFGGSTTQNQPQSTGLFGSSTANQNQQHSGGLFSNTNNQNQQTQGGGLFGSSTNTQNQANTGTGLFGSNTAQTQQQQPGTGLFSSSTNQPQQQNTGLFGSSTTQNQPQQQQQSGGLFGSSTTQNQPPQQQQQQNTGLFGSSTTQNQPQQQQQSTSLFGNAHPNPNPSASMWAPPQPQRSYAERTFQNPTQTHLSSMLQSGLGANPNAFGSLGMSSQVDLARSRLSQVGSYAVPNEKSVEAQIHTLLRKWDPQSEDTLMQAYLYNAVNASFAPFYYRNVDENEAEWEEALAKKPKSIESKDSETVSFIPVLVRGFKALSDRVVYQAKTVQEMRARLHEMNNSLDAVMAKHQQSVTVRLENARRQHAALSQRCIRLAVKAQVLRNKGYPLNSSEEGLRKMLLSLEKQVQDPAFAGREEEIWARMVVLRERARWLEEEGKRLGGQAEQQESQRSGVPEEVVQKTKKILKDYDGQLVHLAKELEEVRKEFEEWEESKRR